MEPDLNHPYGLRTWIRMHLPWWAIRIGLATKGMDCQVRGAAHHWYNIDDGNSGCYYCSVVYPGKLWQQSLPLHEYDVVRITRIINPSFQAELAADYERPPEVGDEGVIVSLEHENGPATVENVAPDGATIWLATLDRCEIEIVSCSVEASRSSHERAG